MSAYCKVCGHTETAHTRTDEFGHTEETPCISCRGGDRFHSYVPATMPRTRDEQGRCLYCKRSNGLTHVLRCPASLRRMRSTTCSHCGRRKIAGFPLCKACEVRRELGLPRLWAKYYSPEEQERVELELGRCEHCGRPEPLHECDCEGVVQVLDLHEEYSTRRAD